MKAERKAERESFLGEEVAWLLLFLLLLGRFMLRLLSQGHKSILNFFPAKKVRDVRSFVMLNIKARKEGGEKFFFSLLPAPHSPHYSVVVFLVSL